MSQLTPAAAPAMDAASLKARFKAHCTRTNNVYQNWQIRVHRSLSWRQRAEACDEAQPEARFLFLWIALNSLYSRWNPQQNAPDADTRSRGVFLENLCRMDPALVATLMHQHRPLIKRILDNPYLSEVFWRDPDNPKSRGHATADANYLDRNYKEKAYCRVLCQVMQRLFVLRGQIVHGASTSGSRLNRRSLQDCLRLLAAFLPTIQHIVIEHGCHDEWPELCYPPTESR
jgi:hypothetical protein